MGQLILRISFKKGFKLTGYAVLFKNRCKKYTTVNFTFN
jgi:hypothetical protein